MNSWGIKADDSLRPEAWTSPLKRLVGVWAERTVWTQAQWWERDLGMEKEGGRGLATWDEKGLECQIEECGLYPESSREPLKGDRLHQICVLIWFLLAAIMIWSGFLEMKKNVFPQCPLVPRETCYSHDFSNDWVFSHFLLPLWQISFNPSFYLLFVTWHFIELSVACLFLYLVKKIK